MIRQGDILHKYFPWINGIQTCVVTEKRALIDGDYALNRYGVFQRVGTYSLTKAEKERKYWVVEIVKEELTDVQDQGN